MKETELQRNILQYLKARNIWAWRASNAGNRIKGGMRVPSGNLGLPDICGVLSNPPGRALFIEVKTPKGKVSEAQTIWLVKAADLGALAFVARCLDDVINALQEDRHG